MWYAKEIVQEAAAGECQLRNDKPPQKHCVPLLGNTNMCCKDSQSTFRVVNRARKIHQIVASAVNDIMSYITDSSELFSESTS